MKNQVLLFVASILKYFLSDVWFSQQRKRNSFVEAGNFVLPLSIPLDLARGRRMEKLKII